MLLLTCFVSGTVAVGTLCIIYIEWKDMDRERLAVLISLVKMALMMFCVVLVVAYFNGKMAADLVANLARTAMEQLGRRAAS